MVGIENDPSEGTDYDLRRRIIQRRIDRRRKGESVEDYFERIGTWRNPKGQTTIILGDINPANLDYSKPIRRRLSRRH